MVCNEHSQLLSPHPSLNRMLPGWHPWADIPAVERDHVVEELLCLREARAHLAKAARRGLVCNVDAFQISETASTIKSKTATTTHRANTGRG